MKSYASLVVFAGVGAIAYEPRDRVVAALREAVARLTAEGTPFVLCSSGTRAEMELVQQRLGTREPLVSENGGAVYVPERYLHFRVERGRSVPGYQVLRLGKPYREVVATLHRTAHRLGVDVVGFSDLSVEDVAAECGLSLLQARLAKLREHDEPFRIVDPSPAARSRLFRALTALRLHCLAGRRFHRVGSVSGSEVGVRLLSGMYRRAFGATFTVGIADSWQDAPLLESVDLPIIVGNTDRSVTIQLVRRVPAARTTASCGALGWAEAIASVGEDWQRYGPRLFA